MAAPSWLTINPGSGNGNGTITFSATEYTGRAESDKSAGTGRFYTATVSNSKTSDCTIEVIQTPKAEFVTVQATAAPSKTGGSLTITGQSNSSKLSFSWKQSPAPTLIVTLPSTYTANGASTNVGAAITGDPGKNAQFTYSITLSIPENTTIESKTATLIVTDNAGNTAQCVVTQAAGDPYLWLISENTTTASVTIPQAGTPSQSVSVLSNDAWTVA